jgi:NADPH oxidase
MPKNPYMYEEKPTERARWAPLARMLMTGDSNLGVEKVLNWREKFSRWMVNEGYRKL